METMYSVPLIPQNLRKEETVVQIADCLKYLSEITNDILKRVNDRIAVSQARLENVQERISAANSKVEKLRGARKAIQVFSSSKYPASEVERKYVSMFNGDKMIPKRTKIEYAEAYPSYEQLEKLQFYHVKIQDDKINTPKQGLGLITNNVDCVNDLLLYNTGKNPYKRYVMSDTLHLAHRLKEENASTSDIGAAPLSISDRQTKNIKNIGDSYFYSPDLGEVPTIDVPLDLPDLPGIADDLRYINETGPGIAPSVTTTPNIPDLPLVDITVNQNLKSSEEKLNLQLDTMPELPAPPLPPIDPVVSTPILPLIPEPPPEILKTKIKQEVLAVGEKQTFNETRKKPKDEVDVRASLMEAIRNAGGSGKAKLKSTESKSQDRKSNLKSGGDLMEDLHAKLSMRRKGISGAKNKESGIDSGSTLSKISSMIPPPPMKTEMTDTNTEDDDWDE